MPLNFDTHILSLTCLYLPNFRSQAAIISEISTVFTVSYKKPQLHNLILPKIGQGQPRFIIQTMMVPSPRCYIQSCVEICPLVQENIFKGFVPYMDVVTILVM